MKKPINIFFVGKGGVGKSTSAALNAVFLAQKGFRVLIVSLDPAHNQSDIFQMNLSDKALKIASDISAIEVDQDQWIKAYLKDIRNQIKKTYSYLTAFNLENYFKVIKHSPGLEEYALILAFKHIYQEFSNFDYLVFDMPPTALALKFFSLPSLSLIWIEQLVSLRQEIIKKKDLVTKIKFGQKEFERDKVLNKINVLRNDFQTLKDVFENRGRTRVQLVLNPDKLSFAESARIFLALKDIQINIHQLIYNKMQPDSSCADIENTFVDIPMLNFPLSATPLIGYEKLRQFLKNNDDLIEKQLDACYLIS
ncbi:MAG: ArsA family ATPase [Deltaproteobacteria bacterium]|nr:ArsA family ATPase [Deltaproteobacteria bacterium]